MVLVALSALCNKQKKWNTLLVYNCNEVQNIIVMILALLSVYHVAIQVSIKGNDVLKYLLDSYEFFPTLLRFIKANHRCEVTNSVSTTSSKQTSTSPANPESSSVDQQENDNETLAQEDDVVVEDDHGIDRRLFEFCDPYVVSGACRLLHNVFLAAPELIEIHTHEVNWVETLTT